MSWMAHSLRNRREISRAHRAVDRAINSATPALRDELITLAYCRPARSGR